ncbi:hypothetical protein AcW1_004130 [Taiwanofungus camphoratus]|nr:hypothetical protein AcV7_007852 [Antrodia cinnamomea]KAI0959254.1 hypothetical protein AcW1_004130 [Antrodia cinnamomea]
MRISGNIQSSTLPTSTMSIELIKVPLLLSAAYFCQLCGTPPQPTPKKNEEAKFVGVEPKGLRATVRWLPTLIVTPSIWFTSLCETAIILLRHLPTGQLASSHPIWAPLFQVLSSATSYKIRMTARFLLGWALIATGTLIRLACYRHLGLFFTFELAVREDHRLVTSGPYSVVRHPAYTGSISALTGIALIQLSPGSWWSEGIGLWTTLTGVTFACLWFAMLMILPAGLIGRTNAEDKVLRSEFGKQWDDWAERTPYRLLPGVY